VWHEAGPKAAVINTEFLPAGSGQPVAIQRLDTVATTGTVHWPTATGAALLSQPAPNRYYFHSRLDPTWSSLADSPELPGLLLPLLLPVASAPLPDSRTLALTQLRGPVAAPVAGLPEPAAPRRPLAAWLVLGAGLLFALERLIAARRPGISSLTTPQA
jgi:hypothetical protein